MVFSMTGCGCWHDWEEATCETPKICNKCGETEGVALGHTWSDATCENPKTCTVCNITEGEPLEHMVEKWATEKESTCTALGSKSGVCSICNNTITEKIPLLEHELGEWEISVPATFSDSGYRIKKCLLCGMTLITESYDLNREEIKEEYIKQCETYTFEQIARNPDEYYGKHARFTGQVIQVAREPSDNDDVIVYVLRVNITKNEAYRPYYTDTIMVSFTDSINNDRILENDIITMYGLLCGEYTYETVLGSYVTLPLFGAYYVDIE